MLVSHVGLERSLTPHMRQHHALGQLLVVGCTAVDCVGRQIMQLGLLLLWHRCHGLVVILGRGVELLGDGSTTANMILGTVRAVPVNLGQGIRVVDILGLVVLTYE